MPSRVDKRVASDGEGAADKQFQGGRQGETTLAISQDRISIRRKARGNHLGYFPRQDIH